jgi:phosphate transport system ATP-binding protein
MAKILLEVRDLEAWSDQRKILDKINLQVENKKVLSIIGPRGSGKSTLLRCINRLFEERVGNRVTGDILYNARSIYHPQYNLLKLRRQFSMVFSEPTTFAHLTLFENVALGMRLDQVESGALIGEAVETALRRVGLWADLKDRLHSSPEGLPRGVRQLVCLARSLVLKPKIILMDEATATIGLQKTMVFEQLIREISSKVAVIFTTSSRKQAARISDRTAFLLHGELIEVGKTSELFMNPKDTRTEDYITGRFG